MCCLFVAGGFDEGDDEFVSGKGDSFRCMLFAF